MQQQTLNNIEKWLSPEFDSETHAQIKFLQNNNPKELEDSFYTELEFGTGGIRGLMGVGSNRMNKYTIGLVTQGFANYLKKNFKNENIKIAIAFDSRNNSNLFARVVAEIFSANDFQVFLFQELRPTPELSFAIRHLQCHGGVVITASHNPKEYNGYKVYWNDGAQVVEPHDKLIIAEVNKIKNVSQVNWNPKEQNIKIIGQDVDMAYCQMVINHLCLNKKAVANQKKAKIVYTPIHGTGIAIVPLLLKQMGFENVCVVEAQKDPNGNFPTVIYPNPEEKEAMQLGLDLAKKMDADILLGTDPDADRVGIGIKDNLDQWILLNGNQTALLIFDYCIQMFKQYNNDNSIKPFIAKTIVTTDLIDLIAQKKQINCYNVLTGFKWIASLILEKENKEQFIAGGEESYGVLIGDKVRDKDAVSAVAIICEMMAYYKEQNQSLFQALTSLYQTYGFYYEDLLSITKKGMDGKKEIMNLMNNFRNNIPSQINNLKVKKVIDYQTSTLFEPISKNISTVLLPKSNVLQFILEDNSKISFRPSGTEPKIKYYFSVNIPVEKDFDYITYVKKAKEKIAHIVEDLQLI